MAETFLVAWRRLDSVPEQAKPWLLAVARRVLANQRRAEDRRSALTTRIGSSEPNAGTVVERERSDHPAVLAALARLAPRDRDAITLIAWDGLDAEEAATVLGCSRATFYVRLHRAKKRLAEALGGGAPDNGPLNATQNTQTNTLSKTQTNTQNNDEQEAERS